MLTEPEYDITRKSRPIVIVDYQDQWPKEFREIGARIRETLGDDALRIDHIGSTSVAGLAAKDIIDIQATVAELDLSETFIESMVNAGWVYREGNTSDVFCGPTMSDASLWEKRFFCEGEGQRRVNIHVRCEGRLNQRYPILFRDFLRCNETVRLSYEQIKRRLARIFPENIDGYLYIKDPLMDIIFEGAEIWARETSWVPDSDFL